MKQLDRTQVCNAIKRLSAKGEAVFGSNGHHFLLNLPLPEDKVVAFEQSHGILLPADYRHFITQIGNGGAGPFYGIFPLGYWDGRGRDLERWPEGDGSVGVLSKPFPHRDAWNDLSGMPFSDLQESDREEYERQLEAFEKKYFDSSWVNGAIPICHQGCAIRICLVVTGEEAGHLWEDDRANDGGLSPMTLKDGSRASFSSWYYEWLVDPLILPLRPSC